MNTTHVVEFEERKHSLSESIAPALFTVVGMVAGGAALIFIGMQEPADGFDVAPASTAVTATDTQISSLPVQHFQDSAGSNVQSTSTVHN